MAALAPPPMIPHPQWSTDPPTGPGLSNEPTGRVLRRAIIDHRSRGEVEIEKRSVRRASISAAANGKRKSFHGQQDPIEPSRKKTKERGRINKAQVQKFTTKEQYCCAKQKVDHTSGNSFCHQLHFFIFDYYSRLHDQAWPGRPNHELRDGTFSRKTFRHLSQRGLGTRTQIFHDPPRISKNEATNQVPTLLSHLVNDRSALAYYQVSRLHVTLSFLAFSYACWRRPVKCRNAV